MDDEDFHALERLNAEIDVLIDEEDFGEVQKRLRPVGKGWGPHRLFGTRRCTDNRKWGDNGVSSWLACETPRSEFPIRKLWLDAGKRSFDFEYGGKSGDADLRRHWSCFFWAKLLRAKIQEKGTDCYLRRLDDMVVFLERNLPVIDCRIDRTDPTALETVKLHVLYLLELAAASLPAESRGFAERARRVLREDQLGLGSALGAKWQRMEKFYDLAARYNIGVSHFHEGEYDKALREFDFILSKWETDRPNGSSSSKGGAASYLGGGWGEKWLRIPSRLWRAGIHLKRQLAYHALRTLHGEDLLNLRGTSVSDYVAAKANLLAVQAWQQLGDLEKAVNCLGRTARYVSGRRPPARQSRSGRLLALIGTLPGHGTVVLRPGICVGLIEGLTAQAIEEMVSRRTTEQALHDQLVELCSKYVGAVKWNAEDRLGCLEQAVRLMKALLDSDGQYVNTEANRDGGDTALDAAQGVYGRIRGWLEATHRGRNGTGSAGGSVSWANRECPCGSKAVRLERPPSDHYEEYRKNLLKVVDFLAQNGRQRERGRYKSDAAVFRTSFVELDERGEREGLSWRQRELKSANSACLVRFFSRSRCFELGGMGSMEPVDEPFRQLLGCSKRSGTDSRDPLARRRLAEGQELVARDYEHTTQRWMDHSFDHMRRPSLHRSEKVSRSVRFLGLQRWNSSSPAQGKSVGGGYLLYRTDAEGVVDLGIAIDPGFDFVRNLFRMGFSLADIDIVLLSHAHLDHVRDFESMVTLLFELKKRERAKRKLHAVMTMGVYGRLDYLFRSPGLREFIEPYIVDIDKDLGAGREDDGGEVAECDGTEEAIKFTSVQSNGADRDPAIPRWMPDVPGSQQADDTGGTVGQVSIKPMKAYHNDHSYLSDSFGFRIELGWSNGSSKLSKVSFGYTGDTQWAPCLMRQYSACDALLVHLGSLIDHDSGAEEKARFSYYDECEKCYNLVVSKNHPYLPGLLRFMTQFGKRKQRPRPLVLISEFGEELRGGIRRDLWRRLTEQYGTKMDVLPVDVGLDVLLGQLGDGSQDDAAGRKQQARVRCVQCDDDVDIDRADFETYGHDEALFCVCRTCRRSTPSNVLQDRLRELYEVGVQLTPAPDQDKDSEKT